MNLLDTNICIAFLRRGSALVARRIKVVGADQLCISSVTAGELFTGALKSNRGSANIADLQLFLSNIKTLSFDSNAAKVYGYLRWNLERTGQMIGPLDLLIAAHAAAIDATLVTNNVREFARVPGVRVEDWSQ